MSIPVAAGPKPAATHHRETHPSAWRCTMTSSIVPSEIAELRQLVHLVRQGAEANERPDLVRRLTTAATAAAAPGAAEPETVAVATTVAQSLQSLEIDLRSRQAVLRDPGRRARLAAEAQHSET